MSRLESGGDRVDHAPFDINAVVQQAIENYGPRAEIKGLSVSFSPDLSCTPIIGAQNQIGQVVSNLFMNAINYTEQGTIQVWTECDGNEVVCLGIRDTGIGHLCQRN